MKLSLVPETADEARLLAEGAVPAPVLAMGLGMVHARAVMSAVEVGLFRALEQTPGPVDALAASLGCRPAGIAALLAVLESLELAAREGAVWGATAAAGWLDDAGPLAPMVRFNEDQWAACGRLTAALRSGGDVHHLPQEAGFWSRYQAALQGAAGALAEQVAMRLPLGDLPRRVLDLGGGHGEFSAALCARHPGLSCSVLDLEPAVEAARRAAQPGRMDAVSWEIRDVRDPEPLEPDVDAVLCFNLTPHLEPREVRALLARAFEAVRPGGCVAVLQPRPLDPSRAHGQPEAAAALLYYAMCGRALPSRAELERWLLEAGAAEVAVWEESGQGSEEPHHLLIVGHRAERAEESDT